MGISFPGNWTKVDSSCCNDDALPSLPNPGCQQFRAPNLRPTLMIVKSLQRISCIVTTALFLRTIFGGIIAQYNVFSTSKVNGLNGAKHGLWTSSDDIGSGSGRNYWDLESMFFTQYTNGTSNQSDDLATLIGTAKNPNGDVARIDLMFTDFNSDRGRILLR